MWTTTNRTVSVHIPWCIQGPWLCNTSLQYPPSPSWVYMCWKGFTGCNPLVKERGIGATLYVSRQGKPQVTGFFSSKLKHHQVTWLPCEVEEVVAKVTCVRASLPIAPTCQLTYQLWVGIRFSSSTCRDQPTPPLPVATHLLATSPDFRCALLSPRCRARFVFPSPAILHGRPPRWNARIYTRYLHILLKAPILQRSWPMWRMWNHTCNTSLSH